MRNPEQIMIIDDDPLNNVMCKLVIRRVYGEIKIKIFNRPKIALESIREEHGKPYSNLPTLLFLDINMPHMTGWEFLEEFGSLDEKIRQQFVIYMLTSSMDENERTRAKEECLITDFLSKPFTKEILTDIKLGNMLKNQSQLRQGELNQREDFLANISLRA
jgi:response regulator RpfG family c-di-GMP phosphodiesterase